METGLFPVFPSKGSINWRCCLLLSSICIFALFGKIGPWLFLYQQATSNAALNLLQRLQETKPASIHVFQNLSSATGKAATAGHVKGRCHAKGAIGCAKQLPVLISI